MPRKPGEVTPHGGEVNMDEETGRRLYGGSGSHQGPGRIESPEEQEAWAERQTNAPSPSSGKGKSPQHPQST